MREFNGTIKFIGETREVGANGFKIREFVITDDPKSEYPNHVSFQVTKDMCDVLNEYKVGDSVNTKFHLNGREWKSPKGETKFFNTLQVYAIESVGANNAQVETVADSKDDLPF